MSREDVIRAVMANRKVRRGQRQGETLLEYSYRVLGDEVIHLQRESEKTEIMHDNLMPSDLDMTLYKYNK